MLNNQNIKEDAKQIIDALSIAYGKFGKAVSYLDIGYKTIKSTRDGREIISKCKHAKSFKHNMAHQLAEEIAIVTETECGDGTTTNALGALIALSEGVRRYCHEDAMKVKSSCLEFIKSKTLATNSANITNYINTAVSKSLNQQSISELHKIITEDMILNNKLVYVSDGTFIADPSEQIKAKRHDAIRIDAIYPVACKKWVTTAKASNYTLIATREALDREGYINAVDTLSKIARDGVIGLSEEAVTVILTPQITPALETYLFEEGKSINTKVIPVAVPGFTLDESRKIVEAIAKSSRINYFDDFRNELILEQAWGNSDPNFAEGLKKYIKQYCTEECIEDSERLIKELGTYNSHKTELEAIPLMSGDIPEKLAVQYRMASFFRSLKSNLIINKDKLSGYSPLTSVRNIAIEKDMIAFVGIGGRKQEHVNEEMLANRKLLATATTEQEQTLYHTIDNIYSMNGTVEILVNSNIPINMVSEIRQALIDVVSAMKSIFKAKRTRGFVLGGFKIITDIIEHLETIKSPMASSISNTLKSLEDIFFEKITRKQMQEMDNDMLLDSVLVVEKLISSIIQGVEYSSKISDKVIS